ncbi:MAG: ABC transporter ATP-binding protein [Rhizobiaceae bacterium]
MTILEAKAIQKKFGGFQALSDVSFEVEADRVFAIIGPNGAGKTTLFKVLTGETKSTAGHCYFRGENISTMSADQRVGIGLGRTFQVARTFSKFSILDNVVVAIEARRRSRGQRGRLLSVKPLGDVLDEAVMWLEQLGLAAHWKSEAGHLSLGDRKRLELAMVLALEPVMLFLDEPTAGMSQHERRQIVDLIKRIKADYGLTIVLTEHDMDFIFRLADRLMVMNQGKVVANGLPLEVKEDRTVKEIYLGKEAFHA